MATLPLSERESILQVRKKLQAQLREGKLDLVRQMAMEQETNGARILDINMGHEWHR